MKEIMQNFVHQYWDGNTVYFVKHSDGKYCYGFKWYLNSKRKSGFRILIENFTNYYEKDF